MPVATGRLSYRESSATASIDQEVVSCSADSAAQMLRSYLNRTPLLWTLGLLSPIGLVLILRLFLRRDTAPRTDGLFWLWASVGLMQAFCAVTNGFVRDVSAGYILYRVFSAPVTGWVLLGIALVVGKRYRLNSAGVVRGVCILGLYITVLGVLALSFAAFTTTDRLSIRSPVAFLLPQTLPSVVTNFTLQFFISEETMGKIVPRLILFYPWSVCLGFAGLAIFFIALQERNRGWKSVGLLGSSVALLGSMSRASVVAFAAGVVVYVFRRMRARSQYAAVTLTLLFAVPVLISGLKLSDVIAGANRSVTDLREGSTDARDMGYAESWKGFFRSPVIGNGWPGELLSDTIPMRVGTHSTFYGVLYTGGLLTFLPFCLAFGATLMQLFIRTRSGSGQTCAGLAIGLGLLVLTYGEGIYSFPLSVLFAFCWMGSALNPVET